MSEEITKLPAHSIQTDNKSTQSTSAHIAQAESGVTQEQQRKASYNVAILESAAVIIGVKDDPLSLVLSSAIERINEFLAPALGENAIQKGVDSGLDITPEATAERIANLSTASYSAFAQQHPDEDQTAVLQNFIDTISSGIEKGFGEARDILEGLDVLEGKIADDIDQTYALVKEKLNAFAAMISDMNDLEA